MISPPVGRRAAVSVAVLPCFFFFLCLVMRDSFITIRACNVPLVLAVADHVTRPERPIRRAREAGQLLGRKKTQDVILKSARIFSCRPL